MLHSVCISQMSFNASFCVHSVCIHSGALYVQALSLYRHYNIASAILSTPCQCLDE